MTADIAPVKKTVTVKTDRERAFRVFTRGIDRWWPREHHIGASPMKAILLEPEVGGRWYAICEDGTECDIGKVLAWEPPGRVLLAWQITGAWAFDPEFSTEVEVRFIAEGPKATRVELEHRQLERYAEGAAAIHAQLDDPKGWRMNLDRFAAVTALKAVVTYVSAPDVAEKAPIHFPAHKARLDAFVARGELLGVGPFGDPREGAMAIFTSREAAEEFVREDPFVLHGVVASSTIRDWADMLAG